MWDLAASSGRVQTQTSYRCIFKVQRGGFGSIVRLKVPEMLLFGCFVPTVSSVSMLMLAFIITG